MSLSWDFESNLHITLGVIVIITIYYLYTRKSKKKIIPWKTSIFGSDNSKSISSEVLILRVYKVWSNKKESCIETLLLIITIETILFAVTIESLFSVVTELLISSDQSNLVVELQCTNLAPDYMVGEGEYMSCLESSTLWCDNCCTTKSYNNANKHQ